MWHQPVVTLHAIAALRCDAAQVLSIGQIEGTVPLDFEFECDLGDEIDGGGDPPRLWRKDAHEPGCAFSRSLGDATAEALGCSALPELQSHALDEKDACCVVASDGVWDFLTNQEVMNICASCASPKHACYAIVAQAYQRWYAREERIDDIACCVVYFDPPLLEPTSRKTHRGSFAPRAPVDPGALIAS